MFLLFAASIVSGPPITQPHTPPVIYSPYVIQDPNAAFCDGLKDYDYWTYVAMCTPIEPRPATPWHHR